MRNIAKWTQRELDWIAESQDNNNNTEENNVLFATNCYHVLNYLKQFSMTHSMVVYNLENIFLLSLYYKHSRESGHAEIFFNFFI